MVGLLGIALMTGCGKTTVFGDAGCEGYGEARLSMPRPLDTSPLAFWAADLDDRMTALCR
jgi:hypothetical protein